MGLSWRAPALPASEADFRDAEALAEVVQRPTMKFVATKTPDQLDLQALHRARDRLVGQRTGIINQIRAVLLERASPCRKACIPCGPSCRASRDAHRRAVASHVAHHRGSGGDWRRLNAHIKGRSSKIERWPVKTGPASN